MGRPGGQQGRSRGQPAESLDHARHRSECFRCHRLRRGCRCSPGTSLKNLLRLFLFRGTLQITMWTSSFPHGDRRQPIQGGGSMSTRMSYHGFGILRLSLHKNRLSAGCHYPHSREKSAFLAGAMSQEHTRYAQRYVAAMVQCSTRSAASDPMSGCECSGRILPKLWHCPPDQLWLCRSPSHLHQSFSVIRHGTVPSNDHSRYCPVSGDWLGFGEGDPANISCFSFARLR